MCVALGVEGVAGNAKPHVCEKHAENSYGHRVGFGKKRLRQEQGHPGYSESRKEQPDNRPDRDQKRTFHGALPELLRCSLNSRGFLIEQLFSLPRTEPTIPRPLP